MKSTFSLSRTLAMMLCSWGLVLGTISPAQATITVANLDDGGPGSLRQAIADAAPGDTIDFGITGTIMLMSGQLVIDKDLTISGPGATNLTVSGNQASRVFDVIKGVVTIAGLTVAHGMPGPGNSGGGIRNSSTLTILGCNICSNGGIEFSDGVGGGLANSGKLTLLDSAVFQNLVYGMSFGGGIANSGALIAERSTIASNGVAYRGGGVNTTGFAALTNCTIASNQAWGGGGGISSQGGITLDSCTISVNSVIEMFGGTHEGGGMFLDLSGKANITKTIIAQNTAESAGSDWISYSPIPINSLDYNLIQNTNGCTMTNLTAHNIYNQDPKFGPLADYGGPTPTTPLLAGSPAIDTGGTANCLPTDQRGRVRPYGAACDIGAFESSPPYVIRGTLSGFTLTEPVTVLISPGDSLIANRGSYSIEGLGPDTYAITPSNANFHIVPGNRSVTVGPDEVHADFKAYRWNAVSMEGISNGVLHLIYAGTNGDSVRVMASSNLVNWTAISTNTVPSNNLFDVFDTVSQPMRFYRTRLLP